MKVAGIDFSSRAVDVVLLDESSDRAEWHRFELAGADAFDRTRSVRAAVPGPHSEFWDDVLAVGIEDPRGYGAGSLYRVQGAILSCLMPRLLVHPLIPSQWRKTVGLAGNASKADVELFVDQKRFPVWPHPLVNTITPWPSDAADAYCIALATRSLIERAAA